jgi:hypothetical protein
MDKQHINKIGQLWQEVVEKKKLDPVGKADADIDNDGDVDKSDEYLHNRRKAIKKAMKEEDEDDIKMDPKGMKKCSECGGSTENHDEECSKYKGEACGASHKAKKESVRHEVHGHGEIISESDEGLTVLFDHGVEFDVPAEQLESIRRAMDVAKKSDGAMTPAVKKINKMKKGLADNPRVQKALKKANEEDELDEVSQSTLRKYVDKAGPQADAGDEKRQDGEAMAAKKLRKSKDVKVHATEEVVNEEDEVDEAQIRTRARVRNDQEKLKKARDAKSAKANVKEGTVAEFDEQIQDTYSSIQQQAIQAMKNMWEFNEHPKSSGPDADHKKGATAPETMKDKRKGKAADDMANDLDADNPELAGDDAVGHDDVSKAARAVKTQASKRGGEERIGDLSPEMPADTTKVGKGGL